MIEMRDAMRAVLSHREGDVVLATETSIGAWQDVSADDNLHLPIPAMSKGSSMALGVALARPDRRVIVWDGDGCLLMNLGSLVTIAGAAPANLYHIVLDNGMYAMTGGQPLPGEGKADVAELAKAAGYARTFEFDDLEEWTVRIGDVLNEEGPVLIVMKTVPEISDMVNAPPKSRRRMPEAAPDTRAVLAAGD
jgi:phosphonopyruvate decarboxylase